jgi:formate hydrogenlyase subunit 3/multisubunit Na+/H+ antiporter MnhD subunit
VTALLVAAWGLPFLLAALAASPRLWWSPAAGPIAALAAALLVPTGTQAEMTWLLFGTVLGLDETGRVFLLLTALVWGAAGVIAIRELRGSPNAARFRVLFLLAMGGNLWSILGQDLASFYTGFSIMGLAAFGLIVHEARSGPEAEATLRAGRVYLVMTVIAELALFTAVILIVSATGTRTPAPADLAGLGDGTLALLLLGLAIKAGLVPVHLWLPPTYGRAPAPVAAVLAGSMSKVAVLGWLRWLPLGQVASTEWGALLVLLGLASLLLALTVGLTQTDPRVVLAYSSVAKAGLLVLTLGLVWMEPALAPVGITAVALFAAHHGLVKAGLFLGVGLRVEGLRTWLVLPGLAFLALALAGAPLTSGSVAKSGIKPSLTSTDWAWLGPLVWVSTVAMALLMLRFLWTLGSIRPTRERAPVVSDGAWLAVLALVAALPLVLGPPETWLGGGVPLLVAALLALPFVLSGRLRPDLMSPVVGRIPPGDILILARPLARALGWLGGMALGLWLGLLKGTKPRLEALTARLDHGPDAEGWIGQWPTAGLLWLGLLALLILGALVTFGGAGAGA